MWNCWGDNTDNCRGGGDADPYPAPFPSRGRRPDFVAVPGSVAMGYIPPGARHASDNVAYCWGYNSSGMNGNGTFIRQPRSSRAPVVDAMGAPDAQLHALHGDSSAACAVRSDATVWWGSTGSIGMLPPFGSRRHALRAAGDARVGAIGGGDPHRGRQRLRRHADYPVPSARFRPDASVWCWGRNTPAPSATGPPPTAHAAPVVEGTTRSPPARPPRVGRSRGTCVLMADGTVRCWGDNQYSQVGDRDHHQLNRRHPRHSLADGSPLTEVNQIASLGAFTRCALRRDGRSTAGATTSKAGSATGPPPTGPARRASPAASAAALDARLRAPAPTPCASRLARLVRRRGPDARCGVTPVTPTAASPRPHSATPPAPAPAASSRGVPTASSPPRCAPAPPGTPTPPPTAAPRA